jgi:hypothetical protein
LLDRTRRCSMKLREMSYQFKTGPKFVVKGVGVVSDDVQSTALGRTFWAKSRNDDVSSRPDGMSDLTHIRCPVRHFGQEVKHRPVMPYSILLSGKGERRHVAAKPTYSACILTEAFFGYSQRSRRHIQNREFAITTRQQIVDQSRLATSNINDLCITVGGRFFDELKRYIQMWPIPTDLGRMFRLIDLFPMQLGIHGCRFSPTQHYSDCIDCGMPTEESACLAPWPSSAAAAARQLHVLGCGTVATSAMLPIRHPRG